MALLVDRAALRPPAHLPIRPLMGNTPILLDVRLGYAPMPALLGKASVPVLLTVSPGSILREMGLMIYVMIMLFTGLSHCAPLGGRLKFYT